MDKAVRYLGKVQSLIAIIIAIAIIAVTLPSIVLSENKVAAISNNYAILIASAVCIAASIVIIKDRTTRRKMLAAILIRGATENIFYLAVLIEYTVISILNNGKTDFATHMASTLYFVSQFGKHGFEWLAEFLRTNKKDALNFIIGWHILFIITWNTILCMHGVAKNEHK